MTLGKVSGLPVEPLGEMVGRQTSVLSVFVPLALVVITDGRRGLRQTWPAALVTGIAFGLAQFATSNYFSIPLTDIIASLFSALCLVGFLRIWRPATPAASPEAVPVGGAGTPASSAPVDDAHRGDPPAGSGADPGPGGASSDRGPDRRVEVVRANAPYLLIVAIFLLVQLTPLGDLLDAATVKFGWPGLQVSTPTGAPSTLTTFKLDYLVNPGSLLLVAGLLTIPVLKLSPGTAITVSQLRVAIATVMLVLALAFVMNTSGQTTTLGTYMAQAGGLFAVLSPILGWLGTAVTGSDTSSNSLFGNLQAVAAERAGLSQTLIVAANSSGGVLGKMISPQNLAIGAGAVGMADREGDLFRKVIGWSLLFLAGLCLLTFLQSTPVLGWMVP